MGLIIGLVLGLGVALAVAVYVTKVPVPFTNKNQPRTPEQDAAESRKNQNWDPNAPLYGKNPARAASAASAPEGTPLSPAVPGAPSLPAGVAPPPPAAVPASAPAPQQGLVAPPGYPAAPNPPAVFVPGGPAPVPAASAPRAGADPLGDLAARRAASAPDPFQYFVQAGAFRSAPEAEAQRAKLSLMGLDARVSEREQAGRPVFRVRVGPFDRKEDADRSKARLDAGGVDAALVRVPR
jgi:cell division protein FtsN